MISNLNGVFNFATEVLGISAVDQTPGAALENTEKAVEFSSSGSPERGLNGKSSRRVWRDS